MAKYTETFAEYLEGGGALPSSSFSLIEGFEDLFKERFCGCELGFETEALFALKLDYKARAVMPPYAYKLRIVEKQLQALQNAPEKIRYETRNYGKQHSETKSDGSNTDLPFDATTATPSSLSNANGSADADAHTDTAEYKDDLSADERLRVIEELSRKSSSIIEDCLDEFKPLFMGVY